MPNFFLLLSFILLVPVIPAYLLFKILPSTGNVSGTLKGMEIKLGGAFAGYFALVFLIISELPKIKEVVNPASAQVWDVEGQVVDENGHGIEPLSPADIKFEPSVLVLHRNGLFKATFATQLSRTAQVMEFPSLYLSHEGFQEMPPVDIGRLENRDEKKHLIKLKPFVLKKPSAPYSTAGPAPQPVDPAAYAASGVKPPQGGSNP